MCGIVGYVGNRPAVEVLIQGLKRLEYRGYDSSGIALLSNHGFEIRKSHGRLENVEKLLKGRNEYYQHSTCGIGHTRWATHGKPTTQNAHPHKTGHVVLVHNGIIENYLEIRKELLARGHVPQSETDSELFGFLVLDEMEKGADLLLAVRKSFSKLQGQCSVVVMSEREPGTIVGVRNGSPLVAAQDPEGGAILASDAHAVIQFSRDIVFLENEDVVVCSPSGLDIYQLRTGHRIKRDLIRIDWSLDQLSKGGFAHFMLKEIHEQPTVIVETLNGILDRGKSIPFNIAEQPGLALLKGAQELLIVACGTAWHAALLGKYWIEKNAKIPVNVELASEFRYRDPVIRPGTVAIGLSQSGETADTLAVIREVKKRGVKTLAITNVRGSTLSRECDAAFYTSAGPEIGVAATKTFMAQMLVMFILAGHMGLQRHPNSHAHFERLFEDLLKIPYLLAVELSENSNLLKTVQKTVRALSRVKGFFFIGRGHSFPLALEGALKLKEIAYDHAEGYAGGELKHGPIAMIDQGMAVIVLSPPDSWRDKTVSNLEEVKARGAVIIGVGDEKDSDLAGLCDHWVPFSSSSHQLESSLYPFLIAPVLQLFSYYRALFKNTDIDKPRNLAKSVTVE